MYRVNMDAFIKDGVVSDVVDKVPPIQLKVTFDGVHLSPGGSLTPTQVKNKPEVGYDSEPGAIYTIICNDPDAPSRADPKFREFHHWLVVNIPGSDVSKGNEMTQYIGSGAPKGTGLHRYVILLYKQPQGQIDVSQLSTIPNNSAEGRRSHKVRDFASKFGLELVAGNFYQAEWDEYVPTLHAQMGLGIAAPK